MMEQFALPGLRGGETAGSKSPLNLVCEPG